ncbi:MAG: carboxymuconolactone decarboxylase family protein, partial [Burkholderiaceae bacterium]
MDDQTRKGLERRKQVMGESYVTSAYDKATDFTRPIQDHITRNAWGDVWQRDGLDLKTRSLITVAFLTALGKQHELKAHVRGALNNGVTPTEIQELLLH